MKKEKKHITIHTPVFLPSAIIALLFIATTLIVGEPMEKVFSTLQTSISDNFGWFFVVAVNFFLLFMIYLVLSKFGNIRLGGENAVPEFGRLSWFAMLFSAGMGIGILFWSVAEPIFHFSSPPLTAPETSEAAGNAMKITFLHWGFHAWGIYCLVGMSLAFFAFNRKQPIALRSVFHPLIGDKINAWPGNVIDVIAVVATLFGLATSLGLGVKQASAGLYNVFGIGNSLTTHIILIAVITFAATLSVASGLDKGVKNLSQLNIYLSGGLLAFVLLLGPTIFIFDSFVQNIGAYINDFFYQAFWTESYKGSNWQNSWTIFYWSWWIAWSPFVGMFIARISKGRTIREFILSVLFIPSIVTFLWISAFGGSALHLQLHQGKELITAITEDISLSLFVLFEHFPLSLVLSIGAIILVISFFITSADSGSLVVDAFTSGGKLNSPVIQRIFWAVFLGVIAAVLLVGGGLNALQTATITTGLPFTAVLIVMSISLRRGLTEEYEALERKRKAIEEESYKELIKPILEEKIAGRNE